MRGPRGFIEQREESRVEVSEELYSVGGMSRAEGSRLAPRGVWLLLPGTQAESGTEGGMHAMVKQKGQNKEARQAQGVDSEFRVKLFAGACALPHSYSIHLPSLDTVRFARHITHTHPPYPARHPRARPAPDPPPPTLRPPP